MQKELTAACFDACFTKKFAVDETCVKTCYDKYLISLNLVYKSVVQLGRATKSDYVVTAVGAEPKDRFEDEIFPIGGTAMFQEGGTPFRKKYKENYLYSDPAKSGR